MIPELGSFAIILALAFSLIQSLVLTAGRAAAVGQFIFLSFAMLCLISSFILNDVSVMYVREHSNSLLPLIYRIGAVWGGHEGSLLLWCLILAGWTVAFILFADKRLSAASRSSIVMILGFISTGFIIFLLSTSNPFIRDFPKLPVFGNDLTPILQDPGLVFHPPILYLGYVGFAIGFAFSISALLKGTLDKQWAAACRPWVMLPWSFLSLGIVLGSWWAYRELGWGGWWFWDPVENASLLPWLAGTALLHSLIVTEKRGAFKGWTLLLAIVTFTLSLLGTFLVRSGVLVSVHAFASDPTRGVVLLCYLTLIICGAFLLYGIRISRFYHAPHFELFSRETFLLINSVVLLAAVFTIVLGTLYPIILDALDFGKISVGEPYFNTVFIPIILPALLLMGFAPHIHWKQHSLKALWKKLQVNLLLSFVIGFMSLHLAGFEFHWVTAMGVTCVVWIILGTLHYTYTLWKSQAHFKLQYGAMILAHLGIAILALGIIINKSYSTERQIKILPGESVSLANYQFTFTHVDQSTGPNYKAIIAHFDVQKNHEALQTLSAEQRIYQSNQESISKAGILVNPWRDLYLALGNSFSDGGWAVRIYYKPAVRWIWVGGLLLLLGGLLSIAKRERDYERT